MLVLVAIAIPLVCLQSSVTSDRQPDYWAVHLFIMTNFQISVFSGELPGTGFLGMFLIPIGEDAFLPLQFGIVYHDGRLEVVK
jgi:hypothetical protein